MYWWKFELGFGWLKKLEFQVGFQGVIKRLGNLLKIDWQLLKAFTIINIPGSLLGRRRFVEC